MAKDGRGGRRRGAGRKPVAAGGRRNPSTYTKEAAREALRQIVLREMDRMARSQIDAATGVRHFILRDPKTGKFERVTDEGKIIDALNAEDAEEGSTYYIYTKDPSTQAFTDLMNRAIDKPKEQEQEIEHKGGITITWQD